MHTNTRIKIAAVVPVGVLNSMAYQYNSETVLKNLVSNFDIVLVVSSSRKTIKLPIKNNKIYLFSNEKSWSNLDKFGSEVFDFNNNNTTNMLKASKDLNCDFAVNISINQYIDPTNMEKLVEYCLQLKNDKSPFGWLYKACQVGEVITYPYCKLPWIINLDYVSDIIFSPDAIFYKGQHIYITNSFYEKPPFYIIDIFGEMTKNDYKSRCENFYIYLKDFKPFKDWLDAIKYHEDKLFQRVANKNILLCETGKDVAKNYSEDSLKSSMNIIFRPYWKAKIFLILKLIRERKFNL